MNINSNNINGTSSGGVNTTAKAAPSNKQAAHLPSQASTDNVSLSPKAKELAELELAVKSSPDIDEAHVSAIQTTIQEGRYTVDADKLANNMLNHDDFYT